MTLPRLSTVTTTTSHGKGTMEKMLWSLAKVRFVRNLVIWVLYRVLWVRGHILSRALATVNLSVPVRMELGERWGGEKLNVALPWPNMPQLRKALSATRPPAH